MIYEFHDLTLDLDRHMLARGGQPVKLTELCFKLLKELVRAAPALVSHEDLIDEVWGPNRVISPDNLSQRMTTLRKSLGDDADNPVYIECVRGAGYRLVPEVRIQEAGKPAQSSSRAWPSRRALPLIVILAGILTWFVFDRIKPTADEPAAVSETTPEFEAPASGRAQQPAIAVLPFDNLSADPSNQYFADGIHDDLLTRISNIRGIRTISRTSAMTYRDSDKNLKTIARELGVNAILEGGVQWAGDQVRINLQLIDAETDEHLWAKAYTRELSASNVFAIQAKISEEVAGALKTILTDDERSRLEKPPTVNMLALEAYFRGNQFFNQATTKSIEKAIVAYREATRLDPEFSLAYSKQAMAILSQVSFSGFSAKSQTETSRPLIDQAILLDPQSSDAFTTLGKWYQISGNIKKAEEAFQQAITLGPNNAQALRYYGHLQQWGNHDLVSAIKLFRMALELDPKNAGLKIQLAEIMSRAGSANEGIPLIESVLKEKPDSANAYFVLAKLESSRSFRHDKAIRAMRKAYELDPHHPGIVMWNAVMHWRLGDFRNAALWMKHAAKMAPDSESAPAFLGHAFLYERNYDSAAREFDRSTSDGVLHWHGIIVLGRVAMAAGRPGDALKRYSAYEPRFVAKKSFLNFSYGVAVINAYRALGEQEKAQAMQDKLMSVIETNPPLSFYGVAIMDAALYAVSGQVEAAITTLEEWVNRGGASSLLELQTEFELGVLASNPEFQKIMETVKSRLSEQKANVARWDASGEMPPIPREVSDPG